ncbi:MAG: PrsW family intramembrane metalloprotease [Butyrivibrio sp.]|nr:PrsW family intramembrane metalloprotease [Butyrivibrio sp.]
MFIVAMVLTAVLTFLWFMPLYRKAAGPDRVGKKPLITAFLLGFFVDFIVALIFQSLLGLLYRYAGIVDGSLAKHYLTAFISYALIEESVKFFTALIVLKMFKIRGAKNYILVFGMVGMGYEIVESLLYVASAGILGTFFRSVFALHVFCQIWMGIFVYHAHKCKELSDNSGAKRNMAIAFCVPFLIHGIHDACSIAFSLGEGHGNTGVAIMVCVLLACLAMDAVFAIITFRKALKEIKET